MADAPNDLRNEIASRLRSAREAAGLSQGQVARRLEMHRPTISEIEAGRRKVTAEELNKFGDLYGIDANWITNGASEGVGEPDKIMLAARELSHLKPKDLDRLMGLLQMLRGNGGDDEPK